MASCWGTTKASAKIKVGLTTLFTIHHLKGVSRPGTTGYKQLMPLLPLLVLGSFQSAPFEKTSSYHDQLIEGFTVKVSAEARKAPRELEPALALLRLRFTEIARYVPKESLSIIRRVPIWVERNDPKVPCMCYHDDVGWLKENGMNPDKAKGVELANLKNFVSWSFDQPLMVLHEYAHAFHAAKYGFEGEFVKKAYDNAMDKHLYDMVKYFRGPDKKAYAATNQMEYFSELSEALFGYNDFFPFTRPELEKHDPVGFEMVKDAWGLKN